MEGVEEAGLVHWKGIGVAMSAASGVDGSPASEATGGFSWQRVGAEGAARPFTSFTSNIALRLARGLLPFVVFAELLNPQNTRNRS